MGRAPIEILLDSADWKEAPQQAAPLTGDDDGPPHVTHEGVLDLFGQKLRCFRLSDGRTVFHADDFNAFLGLGGPEARAEAASTTEGELTATTERNDAS